MSQVAVEMEVGSVTATLNFVASTDQLPIALVKEAGSGPDTHHITLADRNVAIQDARLIADKLNLDHQGFSLVKYPTMVKDFYNDDEVRRVYYPEMEELTKAETGASKVVVFDHTIRVDDEKKQVGRKVRAPVISVHNDFTTRSAPQRVRDLLPKAEAETRLQKRYASINIWRPVVSPVETKPLVICGYDNIDDSDLVAAERHYPDGRIGGIYYVVYNAKQRWYYFPLMEADEVVMLKCFDSDTDGTARWTAHGTFDDPNSKPDSIPRESIEIRTLLFFN